MRTLFATPRIHARIRIFWLVFAACVLLACGGEDAPSDDLPDGDDPVRPQDCETTWPLESVASALEAPEHPCFSWLDRMIGRAAAQTNGSAAIWTSRTPSGVALVTTAMHTLGAGWFGKLGQDVAATLYDPTETPGVTRLFLVDDDDRNLHDSTQTSGFFPLFHPEIPANEHVQGLRDILPRHDWVIAVVDDQLLDVSLIGASPELRQAGPPLYDPWGDASAFPGWGEAVPGEALLTVGRPSGSDSLEFSVGWVLSDQEAREAIEHLTSLGDEEGDIAYDPEVECLLVGDVRPGMSGSGLFDREGRLCGILVRGSEADPERQIVRAVRMSYVVTRLNEALDALDAPQKALLAPWLPATTD